MKRSQRDLFLFVVIFAVLAAIVFLQEDLTALLNPPAPTAAVEGAFLRVFPDLAALNIQAIQLGDTVTGATFTLARGEDDQWTAPGLEGTLDQQAASVIARTFALMPYIYTVPLPTPADLVDFGLDAETTRIYFIVLMRDGTEHTITIGDPLPTSPELYACVDSYCDTDNGQIHVIQRSPVDYLVSQLAAPPIE